MLIVFLTLPFNNQIIAQQLNRMNLKSSKNISKQLVSTNSLASSCCLNLYYKNTERKGKWISVLLSLSKVRLSWCISQMAVHLPKVTQYQWHLLKNENCLYFYQVTQKIPLEQKMHVVGRNLPTPNTHARLQRFSILVAGTCEYVFLHGEMWLRLGTPSWED